MGACGILGLDPLYVANEGSLVAVVRPDVSKYIVEVMRAHEDGAAPSACIIGETDDSDRGTALLRTRHGGTRLIEMLHGGQLPRIC